VGADEQTLGRLAGFSGLRRNEVLELIRLEVVTVGDGPLEPVLVRRLRRARRLRRDLGLSTDAVVIILRLLDRIEALEKPNRSVVASVVGDESRRD
jgi:hypothetical protein